LAGEPEVLEEKLLQCRFVHHKPHMLPGRDTGPDVSLSPYISFNSWKYSFGVFVKFHKKFQIDALLDFHPSHRPGGATQHGHIQTKLRGKPTDTERLVQSSLI
jgi:hypothetical protein